VFLLDEVQVLCVPTSINSKFDDKTHSVLSLLLSQLAGRIKPLCIATGTRSGDIISITGRSLIVPKILSLTPLTVIMSSGNN
jgi:hypothetical protein